MQWLFVFISETRVDYKDLLAKVVCSVEDMNCMLHRCEDCPGKTAVVNHLMQLLTEKYDDTDTITFKQWVHTDRTSLITQQMPLEEFISTLVEKLDNLTRHDFIAKHQSNYLKELKSTLTPGEVIVILDFADRKSVV